MTVKNYVLDINKTSLQHPSIVLRQDDYNIYTVNISVTENGVPVNLGSYTLNFLGITPAGAKIIDSKNFITTPADLAVGKFSYRFPKEAAGSKGVYDVAYFRLKTTSGATSTIDLNLRVLGGIDLTADEVKDYITVDDILLNTLVAEVFKKVDAKVDDHLATVKKGDKGDKGDPGKDGISPVIQTNHLFNTEFNPDFQGWVEEAGLHNIGDYMSLYEYKYNHSNIAKINTSKTAGRTINGLTPIYPGTVVSFSGVAKVDTGYTGAVAIRAAFYDVTKKWIGNSSGNTVTNNTSMTYLSQSNIVAPSNAAYVTLSISFSANPGFIYISQPMLVFASTISDYIQGNYYPVDTLQSTPRLNGNNMYAGDNTYMGTNTFMDGVTLSGKNVVNNIKDTDWLNIPLPEGITGTAQYKVTMGRVAIHLYGIKGITAVGNTSQGKICTLPAYPCPTSTRYTSQVLNSKLFFRQITILTNGDIYVSNDMGTPMSGNDSYMLDTVLI